MKSDFDPHVPVQMGISLVPRLSPIYSTRAIYVRINNSREGKEGESLGTRLDGHTLDVTNELRGCGQYMHQ